MAAWSNQLIEIVHRIPYLSSPVGFEVDSTAAAGPNRSRPHRRLEANIFHYWDGAHRTQSLREDAARSIPNSQDAAASFEISVNDLSPIGAGGLDYFMRDEQGRFYITTRDLSTTSNGYPMYGDAVLLTRSKAPGRIPSREDVMCRQRSSGWRRE